MGVGGIVAFCSCENVGGAAVLGLICIAIYFLIQSIPRHNIHYSGNQQQHTTNIENLHVYNYKSEEVTKQKANDGDTKPENKEKIDEEINKTPIQVQRQSSNYIDATELNRRKKVEHNEPTHEESTRYEKQGINLNKKAFFDHSSEYEYKCIPIKAEMYMKEDQNQHVEDLCIPNKAEMYMKEDQNQHVEDLGNPNKAELYIKEDQIQHVKDLGKVTTVKIPEYHGESCTDMFSFAVDEKGCNVITKYCKLQIPPNATTGRFHIRMEPRYNIAESCDDKIFICPEVTFTSDDDIAFTKKVTVSLHTSYAACAGKTISVEVVWRENLYSPFQTHISKLDHRDERFITFVTEHFCGFSAVVDESQFQNTMCYYQSVAYVRKPIIPTTRLFHWLIFEDSPALWEEKIKYLNDKDTVVDPELIHVRYGFDLQLRIDGPSVGIVGNDDSCLKLTDKWGSRVSESFQFKIEANHRDPTSRMKYNITGLHHRTHTQRIIKQKTFYMEWSQMPLTSTVVNVTGKQAVGISINDDSARYCSMQQSTSTSDVESGVFSPMHMSQYISNNENSGQASHSMQQSTSASYVEPGVFSPMHNQMPQNISSNDRAFRDQDPPLMRHSTPIPNEFDDEQSSPINDTETSGYSSMLQATSSLDFRRESATGIPGSELQNSIVQRQGHPEEKETDLLDENKTVPKTSLVKRVATAPSRPRSFNSDLGNA